MIQIRIVDRSGTVEPEGLNMVSTTVNASVLPALARVVPDLIVPAELFLEIMDAAGNVEATMDGTRGRVRVTKVGMVALTSKAVQFPETIGFLAAHELAHHHELSVRMKRKTRMPTSLAAVLWSEYFAQRAAYSAGLVDPGLPRGGSMLYRAVHLRAEVDAVPGIYGESFGEGHRSLVSADGIAGLPVLFKTFPNWSQVRDLVDRFAMYCDSMADVAVDEDSTA